MDDARWEPGMPILDRQDIGPAPGSSRVPDRIPETAPTPLQKQYINLSAIALVAWAIAITAIEAGIPLSSPIVKLCAIVGAPLFVLTTGDAALRFWRSAWAWMPVNVGRGLFRILWAVVAVLGIGIVIGIASVIVLA
jgi:hypothetical protein